MMDITSDNFNPSFYFELANALRIDGMSSTSSAIYKSWWIQSFFSALQDNDVCEKLEDALVSYLRKTILGMKSVIIDCEKYCATSCYEYELGGRGNEKKVIHFLKNWKTKEDDIDWDVVYPHEDVKRWKYIGRLFSFDQSSYANLFSKEECFWK